MVHLGDLSLLLALERMANPTKATSRAAKISLARKEMVEFHERMERRNSGDGRATRTPRDDPAVTTSANRNGLEKTAKRPRHEPISVSISHGSDPSAEETRLKSPLGTTTANGAVAVAETAAGTSKHWPKLSLNGWMRPSKKRLLLLLARRKTFNVGESA